MKKPIAKKPVRFVADIHRFAMKGEKTGWTYIEIPSAIANSVCPGNKKSFRVKGKLDNHPIKGVALLPMGEGNFIMPLNATLRKAIGKAAGKSLIAIIELDKQVLNLNREMMDCIRDEPNALEFFQQLSRSHQNYFSKWVDGAKTTETKAKRIARILNALVRKMNYGEMLRAGY